MLETQAPELALGPGERQSRSLVVALGDALERRHVMYCCQWKGNWKKRRWMSGEGDIDLLVERSTEPHFTAVLEELGFRRCTPPLEARVAGLESCFGLDPATGRLIHVHVHYQLLTGGFWTTIYRLPFERPLLESATHRNVVRTPAPEFELLVFAIRMVQRYRWRDLLREEPGWLKAIQGELDALLKEAELHRLGDVMAQHLPTVDLVFVDECIASLRPGYSRWRRIALRRDLHDRLREHAKQAPLRLKLWRLVRSVITLQGRLGGRMAKKGFAHGGTVIALVGGDGAGKAPLRPGAGPLARRRPRGDAGAPRPPAALGAHLCRGGAPQAPPADPGEFRRGGGDRVSGLRLLPAGPVHGARPLSPVPQGPPLRPGGRHRAVRALPDSPELGAGRPAAGRVRRAAGAELHRPLAARPRAALLPAHPRARRADRAADRSGGRGPAQDDRARRLRAHP